MSRDVVNEDGEVEHRLETMLLTTAEVAAVLGISERTLHKVRKEGQFPPPVRVSNMAGVVRWRRSDVKKWVAGLDFESPRPEPERLKRGRAGGE